jgi:hypothetical protein
MVSTELQKYIGKQVVVDTKSPYLYIGTFVLEGEQYLTLQDVDVHDHSMSTVSKELYIIEALKYGVKVNRKEVKVVSRDIISISLLEDIVKY